MPSIAQQDYIKIEGKSYNDCHLLAGLAKALQLGTIFDAIINYVDADDDVESVRVINVTNNFIATYSFQSPGMVDWEIVYTTAQYEGLAAIQDALGIYTEVPDISYDADTYFLREEIDGTLLCVDGKKLIATVADGKLTALAISDEEFEGTEISWEDAQKLIGLPIS